jgi:hypothetical protein
MLLGLLLYPRREALVRIGRARLRSLRTKPRRV